MGRNALHYDMGYTSSGYHTANSGVPVLNKGSSKTGINREASDEAKWKEGNWNMPKKETICDHYSAQFIPQDLDVKDRKLDYARIDAEAEAHYQAWRSTQSASCLQKHDANKDRPQTVGGGADK